MVPLPSVRLPDQRAEAVRIGIRLTLVHVLQHWPVDRARAMMDRMPDTGEAVVEFGPGDDAQDPPGRRMPVGAFLAGLAGDRRLVPLAAVLGGVALFGSLVSEWQIT